ncbi:MAG: dihydropteroate synthase [Ignavibacteriales bacterium]|nr:dihydropteroate synthase [Ignavibacteriales bacterium]
MNIQFVNISFLEVFQRYSKKYNIFRENYELGLHGLELRNISLINADVIQKIILDKKEICYKALDNGKETADLLVIASIGKLKELSREIVSVGNEELGYRIKKVIRNFVEFDQQSFTIGDKVFSFSNSFIMGILNATPDSFSDGGKYLEQEKAVPYALAMLNDGADIIDVGGESTRPGAEKISLEEELKRVLPIINEILKIKPNAILSIDTTKKEVAFEALRRGVKIVNDISAGTFESELLEVVKRFNATLILMHMKGNPQNMQVNPSYDDVVSEAYDFLNHRLIAAKKLGIKNIIIDPGIGFGKRVQDNYELIKRLDEFKGLGLPIMIGVSRKSFLGKSLGLEVENRDISSVIAESIAIKNGANIIRTHNVKSAVQSRKILNFIQNPEEINV